MLGKGSVEHKSSLLTQEEVGLEAGQSSAWGGGPGRKAVLSQERPRLLLCLSLGRETLPVRKNLR